MNQTMELHRDNNGVITSHTRDRITRRVEGENKV